MDDASSEHYSMFFVEKKDSEQFSGVNEVIEQAWIIRLIFIVIAAATTGIPRRLGESDKENLTQFGRAMRHLGIEMIPAYSPRRGRSERAFRTHQDRLVKELALAASLR